MINILILCTANQCRSPMAEGILRARAADAGLDLTVSSAGIFDGGVPATETAIEVCAERGIDISAHRSRRLERSMIQQADLVLAMTREHLREAVVAEPPAFARTFTLRELVRRINDNPGAALSELHAGRSLQDYLRPNELDDVADPVRQPKDVYERTFTQLDALLARLVSALLTLDAAVASRRAAL